MDDDYSRVYFNDLFIFWVRMAGISQYIVKWEIVIPAIPPTCFFLPKVVDSRARRVYSKSQF